MWRHQCATQDDCAGGYACPRKTPRRPPRLYHGGIIIAVLIVGLVALALAFCTAIPANALVSRRFVCRLGLALGITNFGLGVGGVFVTPLVSAVLPDVPRRMIWRALPLALFLLRDKPDLERDGMGYMSPVAGGAVAGHGHGAGGVTIGQMLRRPNFWLLLGAFLPLAGFYGGVLYNLGPIIRLKGLPEQSAGTMAAIFSSMQLAASLATGVPCDKVEARLPRAGLSILTALGLPLAAFASDVTTVAVAIDLVRLSGGVWTLVGTILAMDSSRAPSARPMAW